MAITNPSYFLTVALIKMTWLFMLQTQPLVNTSQVDQVLNLTKLLSDFVLTCGSSAGFCNQSQSPIQIEPTINPECADWLECGADCALASICAPDAKFAYINVSCVSTSIYPLDENDSRYSYNMITHCGISSTKNTGADALCTDLPERSMNNLHDDAFKPVISSSSLITYRNIYCAKCNDEDDTNIIPFKLEVKCYNQFDINSFKTLRDAWEAIYRNNCTIWYIPPYEHIGDVHYCPIEEDMISHCNVTGLWNTADYDPLIEWACENFNSKTYQWHYKNIYCYICNPTLVSKYNTELISSCNVTGELYYPHADPFMEYGCEEFPAMPRMAPFKNVFCKKCNGVFDQFRYVERHFKDFKVIIQSAYEFDPLNAAENVHIKFRNPKTDLVAKASDLNEEKGGEGPMIKYRDALTAFGKLCGLENTCDQPYKYTYSPFWACNFPCVENSSCCNTLSSGIDQETLIVTNLSLRFDQFDTIYIPINSNLQNSKDNSNANNINETCISIIDSCDSDNIKKNNLSTTFQIKCENPGLDDILAYIPVTSLKTKIDYKSVYCARCNGEMGKLEAYEFTTNCRTVLEASAAAKFDDINDILRREICQITVDAPFDKCKHDPECIRRCPITGLETNYPEGIIYLCESAQLMHSMYPNIEVNNTLYKNVFCLLCHVQWNISAEKETISQCNQTGEWDYNNYTGVVDYLCKNRAAHPAWYPFKNIYCVQCNMKTSYFDNLFDVRTEACGGIGCIFQESAYRVAFSFSFNPPSTFAASEKIGSELTEFCAPGKTIVGDVCHPLIENTANLRYDLTFKLEADESEFKTNVTVLSLLEAVRQQVVEEIRSASYDGLQVSSVTISGTGPCKDTVISENLTRLEEIQLIKDNDILFEADILVGYTENRSRLENYLISFRNNWTYTISVATGFITLMSHPHEITPECLKSGVIQSNKGCKISNFGRYANFPYELKQLKVNNMLGCVLKKLPNDETIIEELCSKGISFQYDTDKANLVVCKRDLLQLRYMTVTSTHSSRHSVTTLSVAHAIFSFVCTCFSLLCLAITYLTYSLFKGIRTLPGINNMNLALTLFGAQIFTQFGLWLTEHKGRCIILGIITHYFWLCTFCAMNICSFHMFRVFTSFMYSSQNQSKWIVLKYSLYVYVLPVFTILLYIVIKVSVDGSQHLGYGGSVCFLSELVPIVAVLIVPAAAIIIANGIFSCLAYWRIRSAPHVQSTLDRNDFKIYVKLLTVTGVAWPLMFIDAVLPLTAFSFIATFANALQGVFIFFAFICNKKVLNLYKNFCCKGHPYSVAGERQRKSTSETIM